MVAAWKRGDIDAGFVWSPFSYQMETDKGHAVLSMKDLRPFGYVVWNNFVVRTAFLQKYPKIVEAFLRTYQDTVIAYKADGPGTTDKIAAYLSQPVADVRATMAGRDYYVFKEQLTPDWLGTSATKQDSRIAKSMKDTADFLATNGDIKKSDVPASFASNLDLTLMEKISK